MRRGKQSSYETVEWPEEGKGAKSNNSLCCSAGMQNEASPEDGRGRSGRVLLTWVRRNKLKAGCRATVGSHSDMHAEATVRP